MRCFWTKGVIALVFLTYLTGVAQAGGWTVVKASADTLYTIGKGNWRPVTPGMELQDNSWINTGKRGRITIRKDANIINVNPGTLAGIQELGGKLDKTVILQQTGSVSLDLVRKSAPWMTVQTPFLAAIVKGTSFNVTIGKTDATVKVSRGRVGVTDTRRGESVDVVSGQRARVDIAAARSIRVDGSGRIAPVRTSSPTQPLLEMTPDQARQVRTEQEKSRSETEGRRTENSSNSDGEDKKYGNGNGYRDGENNRTNNSGSEGSNRNWNRSGNDGNDWNGYEKSSQKSSKNGYSGYKSSEGWRKYKNYKNNSKWKRNNW